jgi:hypothetical protein
MGVEHMATEDPKKRLMRKRLPLVVFFVYGLVAVLIALFLAGFLFSASPLGFAPVPTATSATTATLVPEPTATLAPGAPTPTASPIPVYGNPSGDTGHFGGTADNPFGLPLWVLQALFGVTAISGLASIVRWVAGILGFIGRLFGRK